MDLFDIETTIGDLSQLALQKGGEELLDKVTKRLGPVTRHCDRMRDGTLRLTPGLEAEINDVFDQVKEMIPG